ncbi:MAG: hypothetical protein IJP38_06165 [Oscillospiraceae bacterium]|nr:hypothetical protein [Oscillospiraceae bacterium]
METNSYPRQFVKKKSSSKDFLKKAFLLVLLAIILIFVALSELPEYAGLAVAIGSVFVFTALLRNVAAEYEYSVRDDLFYVDVLYGVSKRRTEFSIDISHITEVLRPDSERFELLYTSCDTLDFSSCETAEGRMCFYCEEDNLIFIIEPDREIADALVEAVKK